MEEFERDTRRLLIAHVHEFNPDEIQAILEQIPPQERLRGLDPGELLRGLDPQELLRRFGPQDLLRGLDAEERLRGLDPAVVEDWLKRRGH
jgi:hypothetical protein